MGDDIRPRRAPMIEQGGEQTILYAKRDVLARAHFRPAVTEEVEIEHATAPRQMRRDATPHDRRKRRAVNEKERRPFADSAGANDLAFEVERAWEIPTFGHDRLLSFETADAESRRPRVVGVPPALFMNDRVELPLRRSDRDGRGPGSDVYVRPTRLNHSSSSIASTPSSLALVSFEPVPGPAISRSVLADTEPETLAPSRSAIALASSRVIFSSEPVNTTVLPATGELAAGFSASRMRTCLVRRSTIPLLWSSPK